MGSTYFRPPKDVLGKAGYQEGDYLSTFEFGDNADKTTSSSAYGDYSSGASASNVKWDSIVPPTATGQATIWARVDPSVNQVDIQLWNSTDGEEMAARTGITGGQQLVEVGPVDYTPTTTDSPIHILVRARNGDGLTSVTVFEAFYSLGVEL